MTRTRVVGSWSASHTTVGAIDEAIRQLRTRHDRGEVRTAVASIVVQVDDDLTEAATVIDTVREVAARNPIHSLVVATFPDDEPGIDAEVTVLAHEGRGSRVCTEDVLLLVRGPAALHLDSIVGPLSLRGVPVVSWFPKRLSQPDEKLMASADRVLVDSDGLDAASTFDLVLELSRRQPVTDLAWVRLEPWRRLLVRVLSGASFAAFAGGVRRIDSEGEPLLAGWLMNRLGLAPDAVRVVDANRPALRIWAEHDGRHASVTVDSSLDVAELRGVAEFDRGRSASWAVVQENGSPAAVLERALNRPARDAVWEDAVAGALRLATRE